MDNIIFASSIMENNLSTTEVYAYFTCDKAGCGKQNIRLLKKYRSTGSGNRPILNSDDVCDFCGMPIHEPAYIEVK